MNCTLQKIVNALNACHTIVPDGYIFIQTDFNFVNAAITLVQEKNNRWIFLESTYVLQFCWVVIY